MSRTAEIVASLEQEFPGKNIIQAPPDNPSEIICEVERDDQRSLAVVYIERSIPHYHSDSWETYAIDKGELSLQVAGKQYVLTEGEAYTVKPGKVHSAVGDWTKAREENRPPTRTRKQNFYSKQQMFLKQD